MFLNMAGEKPRTSDSDGDNVWDEWFSNE